MNMTQFVQGRHQSHYAISLSPCVWLDLTGGPLQPLILHLITGPKCLSAHKDSTPSVSSFGSEAASQSISSCSLVWDVPPISVKAIPIPNPRREARTRPLGSTFRPPRESVSSTSVPEGRG